MYHCSPTPSQASQDMIGNSRGVYADRVAVALLQLYEGWLTGVMQERSVDVEKSPNVANLM